MVKVARKAFHPSASITSYQPSSDRWYKIAKLSFLIFIGVQYHVAFRCIGSANQLDWGSHSHAKQFNVFSYLICMFNGIALVMGLLFYGFSSSRKELMMNAVVWCLRVLLWGIGGPMTHNITRWFWYFDSFNVVAVIGFSSLVVLMFRNLVSRGGSKITVWNASTLVVYAQCCVYLVPYSILVLTSYLHPHTYDLLAFRFDAIVTTTFIPKLVHWVVSFLRGKAVMTKVYASVPLWFMLVALNQLNGRSYHVATEGLLWVVMTITCLYRISVFSYYGTCLCLWCQVCQSNLLKPKQLIPSFKWSLLCLGTVCHPCILAGCWRRAWYGASQKRGCGHESCLSWQPYSWRWQLCSWRALFSWFDCVSSICVKFCCIVHDRCTL